MGKLYDITQERRKRSGGPSFDGEYRKRVRFKHDLAWILHREGKSYGQIAELLGYATPSGAYHLMHHTRGLSSSGAGGDGAA